MKFDPHADDDPCLVGFLRSFGLLLRVAEFVPLSKVTAAIMFISL